MSELWVEKHRPQSVAQIKGQAAVVQRLGTYAGNKNFPHLLFAGPPGTGKTTAAMALTKDIFGADFRQNLLEMNASDERKLESIRTKVKQFARTQPYGGAAFRFRPLSDADVASQISHVSELEGLNLGDGAVEALTRISQGDLRKALTALQVAAALNTTVSRELVYETSATAPPEALHQYLMACRDDGFHVARRRLRELLDQFGLAGTDFVNQLHRELYSADFLDERSKLALTEWMAEIDYRLVEGGGEQIQLDALTAQIVQHLRT